MLRPFFFFWSCAHECVSGVCVEVRRGMENGGSFLSVLSTSAVFLSLLELPSSFVSFTAFFMIVGVLLPLLERMQDKVREGKKRRERNG